MTVLVPLDCGDMFEVPEAGLPPRPGSWVTCQVPGCRRESRVPEPAGPWWTAGGGDVTVWLGKSEEVLRGLPASSVDAIVTDPPAGIGFMAREWDDFRRARNPADAGRDNVFGRTSARGPEYGRAERDAFTGWLAGVMTEAVRVLKPGGHALVWSIPRTSHWTAWALEDAGLEVRDCVLHVFGQGFPKSLDVSKQIDRMRRRDYVQAAAGLGLEIPGNSLHDWTKAEHAPGDAWWEKFKACLSPEQWGAIEREVTGSGISGRTAGMQLLGPSGISGGEYDVTVPATAEAARWDGFGTALKPAQEMWWLARKPLAEPTVAGNVLEHGTGALNIDGCRVAGAAVHTTRNTALGILNDDGWQPQPGTFDSHPAGRWPPNLVLTHTPACDDTGCAAGCPVADLDAQSGVSTSTGGSRGAGGQHGRYGPIGAQPEVEPGFGDTGGASRFFPVFRYQAKAPGHERPRLDDGSQHETVKPLELIRWLARLITPPDGTILDPFAGSGPVGEAAVIEGFRAVLVDQDVKSCRLIRARLSKPVQPVLPGGW